MPAPDFATVGDNCIDRFLPPANEWLVGGNAVNVAVQLAMLGRPVHYFGAIGNDAAGVHIGSALERNGVAVSRLIVMQGEATAFTEIEIDDDGERQFVFEEFGASGLYRPNRTDVSRLRSMRHVHIGWLNDGGRLKRELAGSGATVSQDLAVNNEPENLDPRGLDIAFCSALPGQAEELASLLIARGSRTAIVTMGPAGSMAYDGSTWFRATSTAITPEDTTGAGDAFIAGFIDAHAAGAPIDRCLSRGTERAAMACMYRGGFPQEPLPAAPGNASNQITGL